MKHKFFQKSDSEQRNILLKFGVLLFFACGAIAAISYLSGFYFLSVLIPVLILIVAPFFDLPMGKKSGKFIYYSPFFITEPERNNKVVIHGGTLFDYFFMITPDLKGRERKRLVLYGYILGLIKFISELENQNKEDLRVRATSYIINQKTAVRFGLKPVQTDFFRVLILLFNYIPITISNSLLKQKLQFPRISEIRTYEGKLSEMAMHKEELIDLKHLLDPENESFK